MPLWAVPVFAFGPRRRKSFFGAFGNQIAFDFGKQAKERDHRFGLHRLEGLGMAVRWGEAASASTRRAALRSDGGCESGQTSVEA